MQELARDEIDDTANEIQDLADEADLPIEALMARYGYTAGDTAHQEGPSARLDKKDAAPQGNKMVESSDGKTVEAGEQADVKMLGEDESDLAGIGKALSTYVSKIML